MHEWLSGRASPCQGEGRGFESRLVLHSRKPVIIVVCGIFMTYDTQKIQKVVLTFLIYIKYFLLIGKFIQ